MRRQVDIIGAAWGIGGADPGCADAPDALAPLVQARLESCGASVRRGPTLRARDAERRKQAVVSRLCAQLAAAVADSMREGRLPCVIGGDHSCAGGTWTGAARALPGPGTKLGLVWVDAHMDSHTPRTSHTGRLHGMPLAWLLGEDDDPLHGLGAGVVEARHVALVGVRSYEPEEDERLRRLGVRVFMIEEVRRRGIVAVLAEALDIATRGTSAFGVSLDLDVVTPEEAPAVGTPVASGVGVKELAAALAQVACRDRLAAIELAEYSPRLDPGGLSAAAAVELLAAALCAGRRAGEDPQIVAETLHRNDA